jgi:uncharacterized membrane protein YGL010W
MQSPLIAEYATYHKDGRNRLLHDFGIPMIVFAIVALLQLVHVGLFDAALPAIIAVSIFYWRIAGVASIGAIGMLLAMYGLGKYVGWQVAIALFVVGWVLQFTGHVFEGKRPAFLNNLTHLLIGPLWITMVWAKRSA